MTDETGKDVKKWDFCEFLSMCENERNHRTAEIIFPVRKSRGTSVDLVLLIRKHCNSRSIFRHFCSRDGYTQTSV